MTSLVDMSCNEMELKSPFQVEAKYGLDGSGNHNYCHQIPKQANLGYMKGTNYIGSFWCPLQIKDSEGKIIWNNHVPNSALYARHLSLVKGKETSESIKHFFKPTLNKLAKLK